MAELNARIIAKASGTSGETPQSLDLQPAELAVNTADGKLFTKHTDGTIKEIGGGGSSDVESINDLSDVQFDVISTALTYSKGNADSPGEYDQRAGNKRYLYLNQYDANGVDINDVLSAGSYDVYLSDDQGQTWVVNAGAGESGYTSVGLDGGARWLLLGIGGGGSWDPSNVSGAELSGDILVSTSAEVNITTLLPDEGDVLRWDDVEEKFRPVPLPEAPAAPVTSVNGETGDVSLGIQDMDDFGLNVLPEVGLLYRMPSGFSNNSSPDPGEIGANYPMFGPWYFYISMLDTNGVNQYENNGYLSYFVAGCQVTVSWIDPDGNEGQFGFSPGTIETASLNRLYWRGMPQSLFDQFNAIPVGSYIVWTIDGAIGAEPSLAPLVEGQVLKWNESEQKFKPAYVDNSSIGINDLTDVETALVPPTDGQALTWDELNNQWEPRDVAGIEEAPEDGTSYVRQDAGWVSAPDGGTVIEDAVSAEAGYIGWIYDGGTDNPVPPAGKCSIFASFSDSIFVSTIGVDGVDYESLLYAITANTLTATMFLNGRQVYQGPITSVSNKTSARMGMAFGGDKWFLQMEPGDLVAMYYTDWPETRDPFDGEIVQYDGENSVWRATPNFAIQSINGIEGKAVKLDVEDLNNVGNRLTSGVSTVWSTADNPVPAAGQSAHWTGYPTGFFTSTIDSSGNDYDSQFSAIDINANTFFVVSINSEIVFSGVATNNVSNANRFDLNWATYQTDFGDVIQAGDIVTVYWSDFKSVDGIDVQDGDFLIYSSDLQQWNPGPLPSIGGGGAVDSVNGQTGAVEIGVEQLANFSYLYSTVLTVAFTNRVTSTASLASSEDFAFNQLQNTNFFAWKPGTRPGTLDELSIGDTVTLVSPGLPDFTATLSQFVEEDNAGESAFFRVSQTFPPEWQSATASGPFSLQILSPLWSTVEVLPVEQGDILAYDAGNQLWKPAKPVEFTEVDGGTFGSG